VATGTAAGASARAANELSSRNGKKTARFVAPAMVSRAYASGKTNSCASASTTDECDTMANTWTNDALPPMIALKTPSRMPATITAATGRPIA